MRKTITWIYQSGDYTASAAARFEKGLTEKYSAVAEPRGFDFRVIGAAELIPSCLGKPVLRHRGEDLLAQRQCFIVGDKSLDPQALAAMRAVYRTIEASDSVLLNRAISGPDYLERDKLSLLQHAAKLGVPTASTIAVPFGRYAHLVLDEVEREIGPGPYIVKPRELTMGIGVLRVDSTQQLVSALDIVAQSGLPYIIQPYLPHTADMRVYVADGEVVTSLSKRPQPGGYISNISLGGTAEATQEHRQVVGHCRALAESLQAEYLCVDWLLTENGPVLNEWSTAHGGFLVLPEPGLTMVADAFFSWIERKFNGNQRRKASKRTGHAS
ncbi:ATP-grasp domain-containing protein [Streptomyces daliensis]